MKTLRTVADLREALREPRATGKTIGLVPTMGAFHEGHLSLIRRARGECDVVVVSLFVNPAQFGDDQDLVAYPRDEPADAALAEQAGVDYLFAPPASEIYPPGFATTISISGLSELLEGAYRGRSHFDAVATVVAKLFNIVGPDIAYFGQKDAQQALVIRRMVRDLNMLVRIELSPIVREPDGLAMSSRNVHLSRAERRQAVALHEALGALQRVVAAGERDPAAARASAREELTARGIEPEYLELVDPDTLAPLSRIDGDPILALIAARVGTTRLIDNQLIEPLLAAPAAESTNNRRP
jgi:pantoate--beta-alanine ligase